LFYFVYIYGIAAIRVDMTDMASGSGLLRAMSIANCQFDVTGAITSSTEILRSFSIMKLLDYNNPSSDMYAELGVDEFETQMPEGFTMSRQMSRDVRGITKTISVINHMSQNPDDNDFWSDEINLSDLVRGHSFAERKSSSRSSDLLGVRSLSGSDLTRGQSADGQPLPAGSFDASGLAGGSSMDLGFLLRGFSSGGSFRIVSSRDEGFDFAIDDETSGLGAATDASAATAVTGHQTERSTEEPRHKAPRLQWDDLLEDDAGKN